MNEQRGAGMAQDIAEQPEVFERLLANQGAVAEVARRIAEARPRHVVFTARGTSDHAALYGAYLTEIRLGISAGLASPSAVTIYGARPDLRDCLVVGVSQSGGSPDLSEVVRVAREQGALTLAVTNAPDSPLAGAAELRLDVGAGPERAVAATKSYTAELLTLLLLIEGIRTGTGGVEDAAAIAALPELAAGVLADDTAVEIAPRYRFAGQLVTTGRGYAYPTAREAALKLMETSYVAALAFSGADLLHGPLAMADADVPVVAVVGGGPAGASMAGVLGRLRERGADLLVVGPAVKKGTLPTESGLEGHPPFKGAGPVTGARIITPDVDERFGALLDILPLQRLALSLALARGEDPDAPRALRKVTATL